MGERHGDGVGGVGLQWHVPQPVHPDERPPHLRLVGVPIPVTAIFTSLGPYSVTDRPASAATTMIAPVARATVSALTWFVFQATRSTAIDEGRWAEIASRTATQSCRRRSDSSEPAAVETAPAQTRSAFLPLPSTTARPSLARPGSTPSTRLSNIRSPESRVAEEPGQRPASAAGTP